MRAHNIHILSKAVLFKLYNHALESSVRLSCRNIWSQFSVEIPELFVEKSLDALEEQETIYGSHSDIGSEYEIEGSGIEIVQKDLSTASSVISQLSKHGDEWLTEADEVGSASQPTPPLRFTAFKDALMVALYHVSNEKGLNIYNLKDVADERNIQYRKGWIIEFCEFIDEHGYALAARAMGGDETQRAKLNSSGLEYAEELIGRSEPSAPPDASSIVPASDRIVELDHNSADYADAVDTVDRVISAVAGDNEYGSKSPEEKEALVSVLKAGRNLLSADRVKLPAVRATLLSALQYVADNFAKSTIAALGAAAVAAVGKLLGVF